MKKQTQLLGAGVALAALTVFGGAVSPAAQAAPPAVRAQSSAAAPAPRTEVPNAPAGVALPPGYVIGADDMLSIVFWRDKDMSVDVSVRPDGKITLPLLNDIDAAGLTPEQLRDRLMTAATKYMEEPNVTVVVKAINSRKVFITGMVAKPGHYPLNTPMTVMQLIATAGGVHEFADSKNIIIIRVENGREVAFRFNYKEVLKRRNLKQNIALKPGDTVVVP